MPTDTKRPMLITNPEVSVEARMLYDALVKLMPGEFVSYFTLSDLIGRNVQEAARGSLEKARRWLLRDDQIVVASVRNEGVKRLDDEGIIKDGEASIQAIQRKNNRSLRRSVCLQQFDRLTNEQKVRYQAQQSIMGALKLMATTTSLKKVMQAVQQTQAELPIGKTMELFK